MGKTMKPSDSKVKNKAIKWTRVIHRNLGYLMAGVCLVYAISGILLNHMNGKDPAFHTVEATVQLPVELSKEELQTNWNSRKELPEARKIMSVDDEHLRLMLDGGIGVYSKTKGTVDYEKYTKRHFVYWINKLHYNKIKGWSVMADVFAGSLIFFALSGLVMVRGKKGIAGRGKWYLIAGLLIPVIYILLS